MVTTCSGLVHSLHRDHTETKTLSPTPGNCNGGVVYAQPIWGYINQCFVQPVFKCPKRDPSLRAASVDGWVACALTVAISVVQPYSGTVHRDFYF